MKNNKLIFLKKFFLVLSVLGLSSSITNAAPVITISAPAKRPEGIKINGLVGNFTFALGKFINRIVEINKALISKNTPPRGCNRFIFYGAPGNGKRSVVQTVARQNEFELIDISGGYLNTISIEDAKNSLEQALTTAQSIAERDNKVIIMIDDMDLIAQNKNLKATFWQKLDSIKNDQRFIIIGIVNYSAMDTFFQEKFNASTIKFENPNPYTRRDILEFFWQSNLGIPSESEKALIHKTSDKCSDLSAQALKELIEEAISYAQKNGLASPNEKNLLDALNLVKKRDYHLPKQRHESLKKAGNIAKEYGLPIAMEILKIWLNKNDQTTNAN